MPKSAYIKALREPIHFLWERRNNAKKELAAEFRSVSARGLDFSSGEIRYDHVIPLNYAMADILEAPELDINALQDILESKVVACLLTRDEDETLNRAGLKSKMPEGWEKSGIFARYEHVGIQVEPNN